MQKKADVKSSNTRIEDFNTAQQESKCPTATIKSGKIENLKRSTTSERDYGPKS